MNTDPANPAEVQKFLEGVNYPASKNDLINHAKDMGADQNILSALNMLPDRQYNTPIDVSRELGNLE